jgi:hypothetical protein
VEPLPPPRRRNRRFWITLAALLFGLPTGVAIWNAHATQRRIDEGLHASRTQGALDQSLTGVTGLRVWGAGMRIGGDNFCGCAIVPKPERVYYETTDPAVIRDLVARLRPRPDLDLGPIVGICGQVTIDFLRGGERVFWIHVHGTNLRSSKGFLPVTSGSLEDIEEWLKQRSVREKINAALIGR